MVVALNIANKTLSWTFFTPMVHSQFAFPFLPIHHKSHISSHSTLYCPPAYAPTYLFPFVSKTALPSTVYVLIFMIHVQWYYQRKYTEVDTRDERVWHEGPIKSLRPRPSEAWRLWETPLLSFELTRNSHIHVLSFSS